MGELEECVREPRELKDGVHVPWELEEGVCVPGDLEEGDSMEPGELWPSCSWEAGETVGRRLRVGVAGWWRQQAAGVGGWCFEGVEEVVAPRYFILNRGTGAKSVSSSSFFSFICFRISFFLSLFAFFFFFSKSRFSCSSLSLSMASLLPCCWAAACWAETFLRSCWATMCWDATC